MCILSNSLTVLVPLRFIMISLVFFYLSKLLFSGFLQFKGDLFFVSGQNNSKHETKRKGTFNSYRGNTRIVRLLEACAYFFVRILSALKEIWLANL